MTEKKERLGQDAQREVLYKQRESERRKQDKRLNESYGSVKIKSEDK